MKPPSADPERANWEVTAIALPCDYIGDFVTVRVSGDWLAQCAWYLKYKSNASKEKFDGIIMGKIDKCVGPDCPIVAGYRDKLIEEEFEKK
jgi:hypothetical protein